MAVRPEIMAELITRAQQEPLGLWIETTNPNGLMNYLYTAKNRLGADDIMICIPSIEHTVFLVQKSIELDA